MRVCEQIASVAMSFGLREPRNYHVPFPFMGPTWSRAPGGMMRALEVLPGFVFARCYPPLANSFVIFVGRHALWVTRGVRPLFMTGCKIGPLWVKVY